MPRPPNWRCVNFIPQITYFKPVGVPLSRLEEVCLSVEEAESIRLKDLEGLEQEECAQRMHISRPTFHRVLESARKKVAESLITGKAIRIDGGKFEMATSRFRCDDFGHEWDVPFEIMTTDPPSACPKCDSLNIQPVYPPGFNLGRGGWGWGRHRGGRSGW